MSEWLTGLVTVAVVTVALREALRAQREAARAQHSRLVDHEIARRRENLKCLSELWTAIVGTHPHWVRFRTIVEGLPTTFDPRMPLDSEADNEPLEAEFGHAYLDFYSEWVSRIDPPMFTALALLVGTPLYQPVRDVNDKFQEAKDCFVAVGEMFMRGDRPDIKSMEDVWDRASAWRKEHLDLAGEHFRLSLDDVENYLKAQADLRRG